MTPTIFATLTSLERCLFQFPHVSVCDKLRIEKIHNC